MRTYDAGLVNTVLNDPAIRPALGGEGALDATALLADRRNVCLMTAEGGAMFAWRGPGVFEVHVFLTVKGRAAIDLICGMLAEMAKEYGMRHMWTLVPWESRNVRWFARACGMRSLGDSFGQELFEMRF